MKGGDTEEVRQHSRRSGMTVEQMQLETKVESLRDQREPGDSGKHCSSYRESHRCSPGQVSSVHMQSKGNNLTSTLISLKAGKELLLFLLFYFFFPLPTPLFFFISSI